MVVSVGVTTKEVTPESSNGPEQGDEPLYHSAVAPGPPPPIAVRVVPCPRHNGESGTAVIDVGSAGY